MEGKLSLYQRQFIKKTVEYCTQKNINMLLGCDAVSTKASLHVYPWVLPWRDRDVSLVKEKAKLVMCDDILKKSLSTFDNIAISENDDSHTSERDLQLHLDNMSIHF